jgi:hypothetical protein
MGYPHLSFLESTLQNQGKRGKPFCSSWRTDLLERAVGSNGEAAVCSPSSNNLEQR